MTSVSKKVHIDKLDDVVSKYNNTYRRANNMMPADVNSNTNIGFNKENDKQDPIFKIDEHVRISKYKSNFANDYTPNWSKEVFVYKKGKNTVLWTYFISDLTGEKISRTFYEKDLQKNEKQFRIEKVIMKKGETLYGK